MLSIKIVKIVYILILVSLCAKSIDIPMSIEFSSRKTYPCTDVSACIVDTLLSFSYKENTYNGTDEVSFV